MSVIIEASATNRALSLDEYVEYPCDADRVDGRHKYLIELKLRSMYVVWNQLDPWNPTQLLRVPEVLEHRRLHTRDLTGTWHSVQILLLV